MQIGGVGSSNSGSLVGLLASHGENLDSHMTLHKKPVDWHQAISGCTTLHQLTTAMRKCCKAREGTDAAVADEDNGGSKAKIICYDAGARSKPAESRYHQRRLMLFAEPQIGKTGAFLGLIEVRC